MQFKYKLASVVAILILLTVSLLSIKQFLTVKSNIFSTIDQSLNDIIGNVTSSIEGEMRGKVQLAQYISDQIVLDITSGNISNAINSIVVKNSFLLAGGGLEADGKLISNQSSSINEDVRNLPWYKEAKQNQGVFVTTPYMDPKSNETIISIAAPLRKNGEFLGAIFFNIDLEMLASVTNKVKMFGAGYIQLVSKEGVIIAHPDTEKNGQNFNSYHSDIKVEEKLQLQHVSAATRIL